MISDNLISAWTFELDVSFASPSLPPCLVLNERATDVPD